jgi:hypothetical protein
MDPRDPLRKFARWMREDPMPGEERPAVMWAGHYSLAILVVVIGGLIALSAAGRVHGWRLDVTTVLTMAWLFILLVADPHHDRRLCERCAAATPLDPESAARHWHPAFIVAHSKIIKYIPMIFIVGLIAFTWHVKGQPLWEYVANSVGLFLSFLVYMSSWQHTRLQPWCPFCNWGHGGEHEEVPDVPAPTVSV